MSLKSKVIGGLVLLALFASIGNAANAAHHPNKKKKIVIVELRIPGFTEAAIAEVTVGSRWGISGGDDHSHPSDKLPWSYAYHITAKRLGGNRAAVMVDLTLDFRDGAKEHVNGRLVVSRSKSAEAKFKNGVRVKAYFDAAPNK